MGRRDGGLSLMITFEEEGHRYFDGDRELVSVTRVLQDAGLINTDYFLPKHAHRGKMVHRACMMEAQGILAPQSLDPQIVGYVQAWRRFLSDLNATIIKLEYFTAERDMGYAGRIDLKMAVPGRPAPIIVDIKSGSPSSWHKIQIGAYLRAEGTWTVGEGWMDGGALYLKPSGRYRFDLLDYAAKTEAIHRFETLIVERDPLFTEVP